MQEVAPAAYTKSSAWLSLRDQRNESPMLGCKFANLGLRDWQHDAKHLAKSHQ